jgi:hypothetical protein
MVVPSAAYLVTVIDVVGGVSAALTGVATTTVVSDVTSNARQSAKFPIAFLIRLLLPKFSALL